MTKENFINKWCRIYEINTTKPAFTADLEAVIANEIAKALGQPQPELNPIEQAYERGKKIRHKNWLNGDWIQKHKETKTIDNHGNINSVYPFAFIQHPEKWEIYTEPDQVTDQVIDQVQHELNPIAEAYERGEKIRQKKWLKNAWIQKLSETESTSDTLTTFANNWDFEYFPEKWELYTEPDQVADQVTDQVQPAKQFDRDRFEAMFRAVIETHEATMNALKQLDAYYALKEGGNNG